MGEDENTSGPTSHRSFWQRVSVSGLLVAVVIVTCVVMLIRFPIMLWLILAESCAWSVGYWFLAVGGGLWLTATVGHLLLRKRRLIWNSTKYAVIAFGISTIWLFGHLHSQLDLESIRAWTVAYQPAQGDSTVLSGEFIVPWQRLPNTITKLRPSSMVLYSPNTKTVHLVYGGGFGHWGLSVGPIGSNPPGSRFADGAAVWGPNE